MSEVKPPDADAPQPFDVRILQLTALACVQRCLQNTELFQNQSDVTSVCTGSDNLFLGTSDGTVRILSSTFTTVRRFAAYESAASVTHMRQVPSTSYLITIAEDLSNDPVLKVWALDKTDRKTGEPRCLSTLSVQNGRKQFPVRELNLLRSGFRNFY